MVTDRACIFCMIIPCSKTYSLVSRSYVKVKVIYQGQKPLTFFIIVEWLIIELSYFTCIFLVVKPILCYQGQGHLSRSTGKVTFKINGCYYLLFHRCSLFQICSSLKLNSSKFYESFHNLYNHGPHLILFKEPL